MPTANASGRLEQIKQRGYLVCGVAPGVVGFAAVDAKGRYSGFDIDICRAVSAAISPRPTRCVSSIVHPSMGFMGIARKSISSSAG